MVNLYVNLCCALYRNLPIVYMYMILSLLTVGAGSAYYILANEI